MIENILTLQKYSVRLVYDLSGLRIGLPEIQIVTTLFPVSLFYTTFVRIWVAFAVCIYMERSIHGR